MTLTDEQLAERLAPLVGLKLGESAFGPPGWFWSSYPEYSVLGHEQFVYQPHEEGSPPVQLDYWNPACSIEQAFLVQDRLDEMKFRRAFVEHLKDITAQPDELVQWPLWWLISATARQRCEAAVLAMAVK